MQTCITLATVRNISFYMDFWTIAGLGWIGMFLVAPFHKPIGSAVMTAYTFSVSQYQVCPKIGVARKVLPLALCCVAKDSTCT